MMTAGERLVNISTLTTATALDHFLNISAGGVTAVEYVFVPSNVVSGAITNIKAKGLVTKNQPLRGIVSNSHLRGIIKNKNVTGKILNKKINGNN